MRESILRFINLANGITNMKLMQDMMTEYGPTRLDINQFKKTIEELVRDREIVRITYVTPPSSRRKMYTGCFYLPERSVVVVEK